MADIKQLLNGIRQGDSESFIQLVRAKEKELFKRALFRMGDYQLAEEVVNQTFYELAYKVQSIKNDSNLSAWLNRVLLNNCYSRLRSKAKDVCMDDSKLDFFAANSSMSEEQIVEKLHIDSVIAAMDESERRVFLMYYLENYTMAAICKEENLSMRNVRTLISNGAATFKRLYNR